MRSSGRHRARRPGRGAGGGGETSDTAAHVGEGRGENRRGGPGRGGGRGGKKPLGKGVRGRPPARPRRGPLPAPPRSLHLPLPLDAVLVPFRQAQQLLQQSQLLRARPRGSRHLWRRTTWERKGSDDRHLTTTANPIGRRGNHTAEGTVAAIGLKEPASQSEGRRVPRMLSAGLSFEAPRGKSRGSLRTHAQEQRHVPPPT